MVYITKLKTIRLKESYRNQFSNQTIQPDPCSLYKHNHEENEE